MITLHLNEVWTVAACLAYAMKLENGGTWEYGARRLAKTRGVCHVCRADDRLVVFTDTGGKISRKTHKPGTWTIDRSAAA
jgi:hypothetical protein